VMSCAVYSSELMLIREGSWCFRMCWMVQAWISVGHSRYHQNWASVQYPPAVVRLESLCVVLRGMRGMRYVMEHEVGHCSEERVLSTRRRS
jgi:hypothetical protein